jgi:glycosyltransferase involved in cell wall biosynthesis
MAYRLLSLVLPMYRQADQVAAIVDRSVVALEKSPIPFEILLVPNGPRDGTHVACEAAEADDARVRVVESGPGWGAAVRSGIAAASGDLVCFTNSARTSPEDLLLIVLYAQAYHGVVVKATRRTRDNWRRRLGSVLYNLECRTLFDLSNFDVNGTPKVFPAEREGLLGLQEANDLLDVEFAIVCRRSGYPMVEVPIVSTERVGGESTTNYRSAWRMYTGALWLWARLRKDGSWAGDAPST